MITSLLPPALQSIWDLERVIDDFILFCFLAGNDFLPHLPFTEIGAGGLHRVMGAYRSYLFDRVEEAAAEGSGVDSSAKYPWVTRDCGTVDWPNFYKFLLRWAKDENEFLLDKIDNSKYIASKISGARRRENKNSMKAGPSKTLEVRLPPYSVCIYPFRSKLMIQIFLFIESTPDPLVSYLSIETTEINPSDHPNTMA